VYIDSLGMIDFLSYLEKELSVDLPLIDLLENFPPTLVALIECIDERKQ
jgi:acyl carrier protein